MFAEVKSCADCPLNNRGGRLDLARDLVLEWTCNHPDTKGMRTSHPQDDQQPYSEGLPFDCSFRGSDLHLGPLRSEEEFLTEKADKAVKIARAMLGAQASQGEIQQRALQLMDMGASQVRLLWKDRPDVISEVGKKLFPVETLPGAKLIYGCICPTVCDCQDYENGLVSNLCPEHNDNPMPDPLCKVHEEDAL